MSGLIAKMTLKRWKEHVIKKIHKAVQSNRKIRKNKCENEPKLVKNNDIIFQMC